MQSRTHVRLTDLPDDVLVRILAVLQGRSLRHTRYTYALATIYSRRYELFGSNVEIVDACYPASERYPPPGCRFSHRTNPHAWGEPVRLLSLLPYFGHTVEYIMAAVAKCCTQLMELSFLDFREEISRPLPGTLFGGTLKTFNVCKRGVDVVQAMRTSNCCLEKLVLNQWGKDL